MLKKTFAVLGTLALALTLASCGGKSDEQLMEEGWVKNPQEHGWVKEPAKNGWVEADSVQVKLDLPKPQDTSKTYQEKQADGSTVTKQCAVGVYDVACSSINKDNLFKYMDRDDIRYIDLRGAGRGYLGEHIDGFESVEYFDYICGDSKQLFTVDFEPRYNESVSIIKKLFPQDKTLFLMCQGGVRVVPMMKLLEKLDYDMSKVYNVTGMTPLSKGGAEMKAYIVKSGTPAANITVDNYFPVDTKGNLIGLTPIKK